MLRVCVGPRAPSHEQGVLHQNKSELLAWRMCKQLGVEGRGVRKEKQACGVAIADTGCVLYQNASWGEWHAPC